MIKHTSGYQDLVAFFDSQVFQSEDTVAPGQLVKKKFDFPIACAFPNSLGQWEESASMIEKSIKVFDYEFANLCKALEFGISRALRTWNTFTEPVSDHIVNLNQWRLQ